MNKFLIKRVDNSILDLDYKKEQKLAEKSKVENKHKGEGHTGKASQGAGSPGKSQAAAKRKEFLDSPNPPYFLFFPTKQEMQMMIKKATIIKSVEEIDIGGNSVD